MNEPNFALINKNKAARAESGNSSHSHVECFERSKSNSKPNQTIYLMVYLGLQKNLKMLVQSCKKIVIKTNRNAFRQICEHARNDKIQKNVTNYFASTQKLKTQGVRLRATLQQQNPQKKPRQIENLCFKKTVLTLKNLVSIADKLAKNTLRMTWIKMQCFGMQLATEDYHNQVSSEGQNLNKNVSRLSNKRKVTKGREEHKQNSHLSATEIIAQNQRLKNELINEQYEREAFVEQLGELLEKHEKSLAQGYSTTRTHKKNK